MKSYVDFTEPSRKIEYQEQPDRFNVTTNYVKLPSASEVLAKSKREPRQISVSPLLKSFLDVSIRNENDKTHDRAGGLSERARNARIEVLRKLGIER